MFSTFYVSFRLKNIVCSVELAVYDRTPHTLNVITFDLYKALQSNCGWLWSNLANKNTENIFDFSFLKCRSMCAISRFDIRK